MTAEIGTFTFSEDTGPLNILVTEDDIWISEILAIILETHGHTPHITASKDDALRKLEMPDTPEIDAVIVDLRLSNSDGLTTTEIIRDHPKTKNAAFFLASADNFRLRDLKVTEKDKFDGFIEKPFQIEDMLKLVQTKTLAKKTALRNAQKIPA